MHNAFLVLLHLMAGGAASVLSYPMRAGLSEEKFIKKFFRENLFIIDARARDLLERASRCLSCGRCEATVAEGESAGFHFPVNAANFIMDTRVICDVHLLRERLHELRGLDLEAMEEACPAGVPFPALADLMESLAGSKPSGG
jgi:hypothetical protein